jgi:hypothetical protein
LSINTPVIASNLAVFREIAQNIPEYIDPLDGLGWEQMILEYAREPSSLRTAQLERLAHYKMPTWSDHFSHVDLFLKRLTCPVQIDSF